MRTPFDPAGMVKEARARAGLTQRALAHRAGTAQSVVARIESGRVSPSGETLSRLLAAAGFEARAEVMSAPVADSHMLDDVARILALTPEERIREVGRTAAFLAAARRV